MRKRLMMTTAMLLLSLFTSVGMWAESASGELNDKISWTLDDEGTLTITGTGDIPDYKYSGNATISYSPWANYTGIKKVIIGQGITKIGNCMFQYCKLGDAEVEIPSSITSIGDYAFYACGLEKDITLPEGLQSIGDDAFWSCPFDKFVIPKTVTEIGRAILSSTNKLIIEEGNTVYTSRDENGKECNVIVEIATNTLKNAYGVATIPGNVKTIGEQALLTCNSEVLEVPSSVEKIEDYAFHRTGVKKVIIGDGVTTIGSNAFVSSDVESVVFGKNVSSIGGLTFDNCKNLASVSFKSTTPPTIPATFFYNDDKSNITIYVPGVSLTEYKALDVFKTMRIIANVRFYAVYDTYARLTFYYGDEVIHYYDDPHETVYEFDNDGGAYNGDALDAKMQAKGEGSRITSIKTVIFDQSVANFHPTSCASWFKGFSKLTTINGLGYLNTEEVTSMSDMFNGCSALESVDLSTLNTAKVTSMSNMFNGCSAFESLDLSKLNTAKVTSMSNMFNGCSALKGLDLSTFNTEEATSMQYMFKSCRALKSLNLSSFNTAKVTDMQYMFYGCSGLCSLDLSSFNTENVTDMTFMLSYLTSMNDIYVSDGFKTDKVPASNTIFKTTNLKPGGKEYANYTDNGNFKKKVGTLGGEPLGAKEKDSELTIDNLTLDDDKLLVLTETEPVKAAKASYSRAMTSTWGTLCLPYDIDTDDETGNCRYYAVETMTSDAITLQQLSGTIAAATPVIFCRKASSTDANVTGSGVLNTIAGTNGVLAGTFETKTLDDADYFIAKDAFRLAGDYKSGSSKGVKVAPYRAYIQGQGGAQPSVLKIMGGQATGISNAAADEFDNAAAEYYTVDGRRIEGLQKGLNIVKIGGKTRKVIVK